MEKLRELDVVKLRPLNKYLDKLLANFAKPPTPGTAGETEQLTGDNPKEEKFNKLLVEGEIILVVTDRITLRGILHGVFWLVLYCILITPFVVVAGALWFLLGLMLAVILFVPALLLCALNALLTARMDCAAVTNKRLLKMTPKGPISLWLNDLHSVEADILADKSGTLYYELQREGGHVPYKVDHLCDVREVEHLIKQNAHRV
mmetsp:Transcript_17297/g.67283  ORF Transcript_17297/g.67283 Transcript_17297/m.67283 type:complete len:204 (+) Transcript_17297:57-668(+)